MISSEAIRADTQVQQPSVWVGSPKNAHILIPRWLWKVFACRSSACHQSQIRISQPWNGYIGPRCEVEHTSQVSDAVFLSWVEPRGSNSKGAIRQNSYSGGKA